MELLIQVLGSAKILAFQVKYSCKLAMRVCVPCVSLLLVIVIIGQAGCLKAHQHVEIREVRAGDRPDSGATIRRGCFKC